MYMKCDLRWAPVSLIPSWSTALSALAAPVLRSHPASLSSKCSLLLSLTPPSAREFRLSPETLGTKFDVILIDPPWDEYAQRKSAMARQMGAPAASAESSQPVRVPLCRLEAFLRFVF